MLLGCRVLLFFRILPLKFCRSKDKEICCWTLFLQLMIQRLNQDLILIFMFIWLRWFATKKRTPCILIICDLLKNPLNSILHLMQRLLNLLLTNGLLLNYFSWFGFAKLFWIFRWWSRSSWVTSDHLGNEYS